MTLRIFRLNRNVGNPCDECGHTGTRRMDVSVGNNTGQVCGRCLMAAALIAINATERCPYCSAEQPPTEKE